MPKRIPRIGVVSLVLVLTATVAVGLALGVSRMLRPEPFTVVWKDNPPIHDAHPKPLFLYPPSGQIDSAATAELRHPIVADAVNTLFHPMFSVGPGAHIRLASMKGGPDLTTPILPNAGVGPLLKAMERALRADGREVPEYLSLVADEYAPMQRETARFAVTCNWKGEQALGVLPGVIATRTGALPNKGGEVVEVQFDPTRLPREELAKNAEAMECFQRELPAAADQALDTSNQQQYHLWLHKPWHFVPLTELQATRVNAALVSGESPERFLSPAQLEIQRKLQKAFDRNQNALDGLEALNVDRSPEGIGAYARRIAERVRSW